MRISNYKLFKTDAGYSARILLDDKWRLNALITYITNNKEIWKKNIQTETTSQN